TSFLFFFFFQYSLLRTYGDRGPLSTPARITSLTSAEQRADRPSSNGILCMTIARYPSTLTIIATESPRRPKTFLPSFQSFLRTTLH
ncbi:hypothetical protein BDV27DRAFT_131964, partial [Aspergillus caelatus]